MEDILIVNNLRKTFNMSRKQQKIEKTNLKVKVAVDDISFNVHKGEIYGLLGPNGAGKTTTLRMLATIIKPDSGDALVNGFSIIKEADKVITKLNKANGRFLDNASTIKVGDNAEFNIKDFFKDMSNYLDDFTNKAAKTDKPADEFIERFHKKAKDLRNITNIVSVAALSAFLMLIPKLYQTSNKFPGKDGLNTGEADTAVQTAQAPKENQMKKEAV